MTPLDLRRQAPRSTHVRIDGIAYLARAIDKTRAELSGGDMGPYVTVRPEAITISSMFYHRTGIAHDDFLAAVAEAPDDDAVAAWVRTRVEPAVIEKWNARILGTRLADLPPEALARVFANHACAEDMPLESLLIDVFDADDLAIHS